MVCSRDILPGKNWRLPMKTIVLAAFAALSLTAAVAPAAHAFTTGSPHTQYHSGPYDNTQQSHNDGFDGGGDGGSN